MAKETPFIGQLTEKVQIYALSTVRNSVGDPEPAKTLLCDTRAAVTDTSGMRDAEESLRMVLNRSYIIRKREGVLGGKDLRLQDGETVYLVNHVRKIGRTHLELVCIAYGDDKLPGTDGGDNGGGDGGGSCADVQNFTGFTTEPGTSGAIKFVFYGGNLLGETVVSGLGSTLILPVGTDSFQYGMGVGEYVVTWQKKCNGEFVGSSAFQEFERINLGIVDMRLTVHEPFNENNVQFPVSVASVIVPGNTLDIVEDSGLIANDEYEFIEIWNSLNGTIGTLSNPEFLIFPLIRYWNFKLTMNDYQKRPSALWCFLPE